MEKVFSCASDSNLDAIREVRLLSFSNSESLALPPRAVAVAVRTLSLAYSLTVTLPASLFRVKLEINDMNDQRSAYGIVLQQ